MKKKALVLGAGRQGKAVIYDLERSPLVGEIIAADNKAPQRREYFEKNEELHLEKTAFVKVDATEKRNIGQLLSRHKPDIMVCLLPPQMAATAAGAAVEHGTHFVGVSDDSDIIHLDQTAKKRGLSILPEMGMDPGIDLILGRLALKELDTVWGLHSYAGGIPETGPNKENPLGYKITWTFQGVLESYHRPARLLRGGDEINISGRDIFDPHHVHTIEISELGTLEAFPNGDALHYAKLYGMTGGSKDVGRFALRWPGHCHFWRIMSALGFLDDAPIKIKGKLITPVEFLTEHLTPRLQFKEKERDVAILRAHAWGFASGTPIRAAYNMIDNRDMRTGFFAMNRTVGFAASIGAQMILSGHIDGKGVLSPVRDVPPEEFLQELKKRGITVERQITEE